MNFIKSTLQTIALFMLCCVSFAAVYFIWPILMGPDARGGLLDIWVLLMANAAFFGFSYWHLTDLKADGFLPRANSYVLIWIIAIVCFVAVPGSVFAGLEIWEVIYSAAQAGAAAYVTFISHAHRKSQQPTSLNSNAETLI